MRIALVCMTCSSPTAPRRDVRQQGSQVEALAHALAGRGHDVVIHTRRDTPDLPARVRLGTGVTVHRLDAGPQGPLAAEDLGRTLPRFASELSRSWLAQPPSVAHAHFWDSGLASTQAGAIARVPVALTLHAMAPRQVDSPGQTGLSATVRLDAELSLARSTAQIIAATEAEARELVRRGTRPDRLTVVPHGVDVTLFSPRGPEAPRASWHYRLLTLGALTPEGGIDDAIRMLAQLPVAELVVVGGPPPPDLDADADVARLRILAEELQVADRVSFLGAVPRADLPALIRSASVVVSLPWHEPSVGSVLEAMACGRPVVVTAAGALPDVVDDGVTGLIVEAQSPSSAAHGVRRLLSAPGLRDAMSAEARARVEREFDWHLVAQSAETVYRAMRAREHMTIPRLARLPAFPADPRGVATSGRYPAPARRSQWSPRGEPA